MEAEQEAEAVARDHAASIGGTLLMPLETFCPGLSQPQMGSVFWTERRFKGSNEDYLKKFGLDGLKREVGGAES